MSLNEPLPEQSQPHGETEAVSQKFGLWWDPEAEQWVGRADRKPEGKCEHVFAINAGGATVELDAESRGRVEFVLTTPDEDLEAEGRQLMEGLFGVPSLPTPTDENRPDDYNPLTDVGWESIELTVNQEVAGYLFDVASQSPEQY